MFKCRLDISHVDPVLQVNSIVYYYCYYVSFFKKLISLICGAKTIQIMSSIIESELYHQSFSCAKGLMPGAILIPIFTIDQSANPIYSHSLKEMVVVGAEQIYNFTCNLNLRYLDYVICPHQNIEKGVGQPFLWPF